MAPRYTEAQARRAIANSRSWAEALRKLHYCHTGGNPRTLKKYAGLWGIPTDHFDPTAAPRDALRRNGMRTQLPLDQILVRGSSYSRSNLKRRLFVEGLKRPRCEMCGQDEIWRGQQMGLILDHINGVRDDNRIENLRILCPNCAATLDTHCGRNRKVVPFTRECLRCGRRFRVKYPNHRYCSRECGSRWSRREAAQKGRGQFGCATPLHRKVERPPYDQLLREIEESSYLAVGRKYGVSDNAIRKWVRWYEREAERRGLEAQLANGSQLTLPDP
jgi:transposase-like protein